MILHLGSGIVYLRGTATTPRFGAGERDPTAVESLSQWFYPKDLQNLVFSYKYPVVTRKVLPNRDASTQDANSRSFDQQFSAFLPAPY
jgi:hypothetical protein